jgi:hypothetical protein
VAAAVVADLAAVAAAIVAAAVAAVSAGKPCSLKEDVQSSFSSHYPLLNDKLSARSMFAEKFFLLAVILLPFATAQQSYSSKPAASNSYEKDYPRVHADGRVTFQSNSLLHIL